MTVGSMIMTKPKFAKRIEEIVRLKNLSYIDAVLYFCEKNNLDEIGIHSY